MRQLEQYVHVLAYKVQQTWEQNVRLEYATQLKEADNPELKGNLEMHVLRQHAGQYNYGRNYHVEETDDRYLVKFDCNVSGMPSIHCVVSKATGDVAKSCIKLVEEPYFPYNLLDEQSRNECFGAVSFNREYLAS